MQHAALPLSKRSTADDRRAAIAAAARTLIVEKGVEGLRTRDIAERVGINIATLHYHVPSKEALIELVAESLRHDFIKQSVDRPRAHLSGSERLELEFTDFRDIALDRPEILLVFSELMERARRDEIIAAAIHPMKQYWREAVAELLAQGVREGAFRPDVDPETFARIYISTVIGFCRNPQRNEETFNRIVGELRRAVHVPRSTRPVSKSAEPHVTVL